MSEDELLKLSNEMRELLNAEVPEYLTPPDPIERINLGDMLRDFSNADRQYEIIKQSIQEFEKDLDEESEVAVHLAAFGQSILMQVTELGYSNPSLIHFYGYVNGAKSELIQHVNQLSFLLTAVPKTNPDRPARRIGFIDEES